MGFGVWGLGFGVWGLGFGVWGLGFGVWGLGFGVWGLGFGVWGLGFGVWGLGFGVWGLGFGVWGLGFGVWGLGFGVWGLGFGVWISAALCDAQDVPSSSRRRSCFAQTPQPSGRRVVALAFNSFSFGPSPVPEIFWGLPEKVKRFSWRFGLMA